MPEYQITIEWQFDRTDEDSNYLNDNNIPEKPVADTPQKPPTGFLIRGNHAISKNSLSECLQKNGPVEISIIESYLDILCAYHNQKHPALKDHLPRYINLGHTFFEKLTQRPSPESQDRGLKWGTKRLREVAPDLAKSDRRASLLQVEHLLVPIKPEFDSEKNPDFTDPHHVALLVVSPRIKLIEYFDSRHEKRDNSQNQQGDKYIYLMFEYLTYELGGAFKRNEWSCRRMQGPVQQLADGSNPDEEVYKRTVFNSGNDGPIHAAIHAWNCLFGFSLYAENRALFNVHEDIVKKRHRIVVDICANQILLKDKFDFDTNLIHVPTVINNYYLGVTENEFGDWVTSRQRHQQRWQSGYPDFPHCRYFENMTSLKYYKWAVSYGRPRCGRKPEEEGTKNDGSSMYPMVVGMIRNRARRRELLLNICRYLEIGGKEEVYGEKEGWAEKVLMRAILAYIDENKNGFRDLGCEVRPDDLKPDDGVMRNIRERM